mgnify:CR=1 FL=1|uniref:Protein kinase domain-containing protein n=1 Tax=viral metagenome TaxID=1070528 RepID=A0A6C0AXC5_9ZZZZ|tara:strand:+ start:5778 stop:7091 length:1314 start_codon:yes stop_codon:yes gene_type:complete
MNGGLAIASGGFGCVFRPPIKCKNKKKTKKNRVSKLMLKEYANIEVNESKEFIKDIEKIPKSDKLFIIPREICNPDELTSNDLVNFDNKCNSLTRYDITSKNINKSLKKVKIIQLPEGGTDLKDYFDNNIITIDNFKNINTKLNLLLNGIVKINKKNIYHFDVKSSNMLIQNKNIRLIDWGLSSKIKKEYITNRFIPLFMKYRSLHYNMPYSIVMLNDEAGVYINSFLQTKYKFNELVDFLYNLYENIITVNVFEKGHDDLVKYMLKNYLYPSKNPDLIIFTYIAEIIDHFNKNGRFNVEDYFYNVYLKNCDIWGFSTVYLAFAIDNIHNLSLTVKDRNKIKDEILRIFKKYTLGCSYKPIPVKEYSKELLKLNQLINNFKEDNKNIIKDSSVTNRYNTETKKTIKTLDMSKKISTSTTLKKRSKIKNTTLKKRNKK